jgi:hypothetical protein
VAYKFPDLNKLPKPFSTGTAFIYADSNTPWHLSELAIDDKDSALGKTVSQLFAAKRNKVENSFVHPLQDL